LHTFSFTGQNELLRFLLVSVSATVEAITRKREQFSSPFSGLSCREHHIFLNKGKNETKERSLLQFYVYSDSSSSEVGTSSSSAGGTSLKSRPSAGKSGVSGPRIPSELRLNPLCKKS